MTEDNVWTNSDLTSTASVSVTGVSGTGLFLAIAGLSSSVGQGDTFNSFTGASFSPVTSNQDAASSFSVVAQSYTGTLSGATIAANWNALGGACTKIICVVLITGYDASPFNAINGNDGGSWTTNDIDIAASYWTTGWTAGSLAYGCYAVIGGGHTTYTAQGNTDIKVQADRTAGETVVIFRKTAVTTTTEEDFGTTASGWDGSCGLAVEVKTSGEQPMSQARLRSGS